MSKRMPGVLLLRSDTGASGSTTFLLGGNLGIGRHGGRIPPGLERGGKSLLNLETSMKLEITKEWFESRAALEGELEIGAGRRRRAFPPAYGNCRCACHHSDLMHCMPCCHPSDDDFRCMDADVRAYLDIRNIPDR